MPAARTIKEIVAEIESDWERPYFGAVPYIAAMKGMSDDPAGKFGEDDNDSVVIYFLSNAKTWRGEVARRVKAELKEWLKRDG